MKLRAVRTTLSALALSSLIGCDANDRVLTPDEPNNTGGTAGGAGVDQDSGTAQNGGSSGTSGSGTTGSTATGGTTAGASSSTNTGGTTGSSTDTTSGSTGTSGSSTGGDATGGSTSGSTGGEQHAAADPDCDMNGIWIGRQVTESLALSVSQYANNWYYLEFSQDGTDVVVSNHYDCGIEVRGSATVILSDKTTLALTQHNGQVGRRGTMVKDSDGTCHFEMERFWSVRGVSEEQFAPSPRNSEEDIAYWQAQAGLPTTGAGAEDWDADGEPGIAWQVTGVVTGTRHSGQRDWTRWFSSDAYPIQASVAWSEDLLVEADFNNEEKIYATCIPNGQGGCGLFSALLNATSEPAAANTLTLRFLGRSEADVRDVVVEDVLQTCKNIQAALPALDAPQ